MNILKALLVLICLAPPIGVQMLDDNTRFMLGAIMLVLLLWAALLYLIWQAIE